MQRTIDSVAAVPPRMSATEFARRAGINRSTLHRILGHEVTPSLATVRELAIQHGLDVSVSLVPLSDPDAAAAARLLLDPAEFSIPDGVADGVREWVDRLRRATDDPAETVLLAGHASSLLHRRGAILLRGDSSALRVASAGDASGGEWMLSGRAALDLTRPGVGSGPTVLWAEHPDAAAQTLRGSHDRVESALNAQVVIVGAEPGVFIDSYEIGAMRYASPLQMVLDGVGLGDELEQEAVALMAEWSR
jgi:transcriptional regulator with XRE-family HTH domain